MFRILPLIVIVGAGLWWFSASRQPPTAADTGASVAAVAPPVAGQTPDPAAAAPTTGSDAPQERPGPPSETSGDGPKVPPPPESSSPDKPAGSTTPRATYEHLVQGVLHEVSNWTAQEVRALEDRAALDGETLYTAYRFVFECVGAPSRDDAARSMREQYAANPDHPDAADWLRTIESLESQQARCEDLPDDRLGLAYELLEMAALRGYELAIIDYPSAAMQLFGRDPDWLFRDPQMVLRYRETTLSAVQIALGRGLPEGLAVQAAILADGRLAEPEPVLALAYAYAAREALNGEFLPVADPVRVIEWVEPQLSREDLQAAEDQARTLCERYCD